MCLSPAGSTVFRYFYVTQIKHWIISQRQICLLLIAMTEADFPAYLEQHLLLDHRLSPSVDLSLVILYQMSYMICKMISLYQQIYLLMKILFDQRSVVIFLSMQDKSPTVIEKEMKDNSNTKLIVESVKKLLVSDKQ